MPFRIGIDLFRKGSTSSKDKSWLAPRVEKYFMMVVRQQDGWGFRPSHDRRLGSSPLAPTTPES